MEKSYDIPVKSCNDWSISPSPTYEASFLHVVPEITGKRRSHCNFCIMKFLLHLGWKVLGILIDYQFLITFMKLTINFFHLK